MQRAFALIICLSLTTQTQPVTQVIGIVFVPAAKLAAKKTLESQFTKALLYFANTKGFELAQRIGEGLLVKKAIEKADEAIFHPKQEEPRTLTQAAEGR